jgi:hypothetical protein
VGPSFFALVGASRTRTVDHLPGKHDQSTHGRGGGMRQSLKDAKSVEEVADVVAGEAGRITGHAVEVDFAGSNLQVAREHAEGVLRGVERFPHTALTLVTTYGPGAKRSELADRADAEARGAFAVTTHDNAPPMPLPGGFRTSGTGIAFNNARTTEPDKYRADLARMQANGWSVIGSPRGVALHEFGHVVQEHGRPSQPAHAVAQHVAAKASAAGMPPTDYAAKHISTYAAQNDSELSGEVVGDVMVNGVKASPVSKSAFQVLEEQHLGFVREVGLDTGIRPTAKAAPLFFGLVGIARERLDILDRTYKRDRQGQFSSGGGVTGQAALDAVPAKLAPGERGHFGDYEGESLSGPPGMGSARALSEYEGVEYDRTNGYLRRGPLADRLAGQPGVHDLDGVRQMDAETAARIADIDQTMAASRLAADVQVERGVGRGQDLFGDAWHEGVMNKATKDFDEQDREHDRWVAGERPDLTGLRFRDKGYTSTTADPHVAEQFVASRAKWKQESPDSEGEPVVMKIQVPAGTGAVQLGTMAAPGAKLGRQDSAEILLERGLTYEVTADHGVDAAGFRRLDVSVVPGG